MALQPNLRELKSVVSARILHEPGVAGVGLPDGQLTVYLEDDSPTIKRHLKDIIEPLIGNAASVSFLVTGAFHAGRTTTSEKT